MMHDDIALIVFQAGGKQPLRLPKGCFFGGDGLLAMRQSTLCDKCCAKRKECSITTSSGIIYITKELIKHMYVHLISGVKIVIMEQMPY